MGPILSPGPVAAPAVLCVLDRDPRLVQTTGRALARFAIQCLPFRDLEALIHAWPVLSPTAVALDSTEPDCLGAIAFLASQHFPGPLILLDEGPSLNQAIAQATLAGIAVAGWLPKPFAQADLIRLVRPPVQDATQVTAADLADALARNHIQPFFQPVLCGATRTPYSGEALARWRHPQRGMVPPHTFITLAEQHGLIHPLTDAMLAHAAAAWQHLSRRGQPLSLAVNVSASSLTDARFVDRVHRILEGAGMPPEQLVLEVTETVAMEGGPTTAEALGRLRALGISLALDDFGTGYSSLARLYRMPFSQVKIDRTFIAALPFEREAQTIVRALIELAHRLGQRVVAEGVECEATADLLQAWGCDALQGYWIAGPKPLAEFALWLAPTRTLPLAAE